jgi:hypothetical protein
MLVVPHQARRRVQRPVDESAVDRARGSASVEVAAPVLVDRHVLTVGAQPVEQWVERRQCRVVDEGGVEAADEERDREGGQRPDYGEGTRSPFSARYQILLLEPQELADYGDAGDVAQHREPERSSRIDIEEHGVRIVPNEERLLAVVLKMDVAVDGDGKRKPQAGQKVRSEVVS